MGSTYPGQGGEGTYLGLGGGGIYPGVSPSPEMGVPHVKLDEVLFHPPGREIAVPPCPVRLDEGNPPPPNQAGWGYPPWTDRQTGVKTLPSLVDSTSYAGGNGQ